MNEQLGTISTLLIYGTISAYVVAMVGFAVDLSGFGKGADPGRARKAVGIAMSTSWLGLIFHVGAVVLRAIAAERVPWADMYEFTLMSTMFTMVVFMVVNRHKGHPLPGGAGSADQCGRVVNCDHAAAHRRRRGAAGAAVLLAGDSRIGCLAGHWVVLRGRSTVGAAAGAGAG